MAIFNSYVKLPETPHKAALRGPASSGSYDHQGCITNMNQQG